MNRVLVIGGDGFIGRHLVPELVDAGYDVMIADDKSGGHLDPDDAFDLVAGRARVDTRVRDAYVSEITSVGAWATGGVYKAPNIVVNLAAVVGRAFGEDNKSLTIQQNAELEMSVALGARESGCRVVYASSSEVYGDQGSDEVFEWSRPSLPANLYGLTKRWGEEVTALYAPTWQIVRLSMPFGPGLPAGKGRAAIINFLYQAATGRPLTVHADASRSWCYVADTTRGIRRVIDSGFVAQGGSEYGLHYGIYNVGSDAAALSMRDVAHLCLAAAGVPESEWQDRVLMVDAPPGQTLVKNLNVQRLRDLNWERQYSVEAGIRMTLAEMRRDGTIPGVLS